MYGNNEIIRKEIVAYCKVAVFLCPKVVSFEHDNDSRAKLSFCEKNEQEYKIYLNNCKGRNHKADQRAAFMSI